MMNKAPILEIEPKELKFIFELKKQSSCSVQLTNNTNHHVAFKIKTKSPKKYCVRPNVGVLAPKSTCELIITMQAQQVAPEEMVCKDKFLIQSTLVPVETTSEDVTAILFVKDGMRYVEESKLNVALISLPNSPEIAPVNGDSKNQQFDHEKVQIYSKDEIQSPKPMILEVEPKELQFIFELMKQCSCSVQLTNKTYHHVAFKMKTTSPKKYCVRPNVGVLAPKSTCELIVMMQAQKVAPEEMVCKDKFLIQSTLVPAETTKDVTASLFVKDGMRYVEESKLKVALISPPYSPEIATVNGDSKNQQFDHEKVQIYSKDEIQSPKPMVRKNFIDFWVPQSTLVPAETTKEYVTANLFVKDGMRCVEENKLKVALISSPDSPKIALNGDSKNRQLSSIAAAIVQLFSRFWPSCNANGYTRLL